MTRIAWWRVALVAGAMSIALAIAIGYSAWRSHQAAEPARIEPIVASQETQLAIVQALLPEARILAQSLLPPPPPPPQPPSHAPIRPEEGDHEIEHILVFCSESVEICAGGAGDCGPLNASALLYPGLAPAIPKRWKEELVGANATVALLPCPASADVECVRASDVHELFATGGWDAFRNRFRNGLLLEASRAVLSPDGNHALVYFGMRCGGLCGAGYLLQLRKASDGWHVEKRARLWVS